MDEKVVLITGASKGIGAQTAVHLVKAGYCKLALVARSKPRLEETASKCKESGTNVDVLVLEKDLSSSDDCKSVIPEVIKHFGRLDIFISNAGGVSKKVGTNVRETQLEDFEYEFKLNLTAPFILTHDALPFLEATRGNILYISSVGSKKPSAGFVGYCSAKAALDQMAKVVALEESPRGVRSNCFNPGFIMTDTHLRPGQETLEKACEQMRGYQPLGRPGEVEECCKMIEFLISDKNSFMNGSQVVSDGGYLLQ